MTVHRRLGQLHAQLEPTAVAATQHSSIFPPPSDPPLPGERQRLTAQQLAFVETFGYLHLPGLLADRLEEIISAFSEVWGVDAGGMPTRPSTHGGTIGEVHDGSRRSCIVPFIDRHPVLSGLLDDPRVNGVFSSLLGDDYVYLGSDGNWYVGDTGWHSDGDWGEVHPDGSLPFRSDIGEPPRHFIKMALYLDHVTRDSGALRVIPGSHQWGDKFADSLDATFRGLGAVDAYGTSQAQIPAVVLESRPGDVCVFIQSCKHASFGGNSRRRMFTINCTERYRGARGIKILRRELEHVHASAHRTDVYEGAMLETATEGRMLHLEQVVQERDFFMKAVDKARQKLEQEG